MRATIRHEGSTDRTAQTERLALGRVLVPGAQPETVGAHLGVDAQAQRAQHEPVGSSARSLRMVSGPVTRASPSSPRTRKSAAAGSRVTSSPVLRSVPATGGESSSGNTTPRGPDRIRTGPRPREAPRARIQITAPPGGSTRRPWR